MKNIIFISLLVQILAGCTNLPLEAHKQIYAVRFITDPLDHKNTELIQQLIITASPASIYRLDKIPYDWSVAASAPLSSEVTCELNGNHGSSAIANIHELDDVVYICVDHADTKNLEVIARLFITEGQTGPGRTLSLGREQLNLKPMTCATKDIMRAQQAGPGYPPKGVGSPDP